MKKTSEVLLKLAEVLARYGDVPIRVYNRDFVGYAEECPDWQVADIDEIRVDGMEVEVWI